MNVLIITGEPPFDARSVATGNAIRCKQLRDALEQAGHDTDQVWLASREEQSADAFHSRDVLASLIQKESPDIILVCYWELVGLLPSGLEQPIVLDFVAPRPLEVLFENPEVATATMQRLRLALAHCDLVLTGNSGQEKLLTYNLIEAGFDLRQDAYTRVVPLSAPIVPRTGTDPAGEGWTLVGGGVDWPWRQAGDHIALIREMEAESDGKFGLILFGGTYRWHKQDSHDEDGVTGNLQSRELTSYDHYSAFLSESAHIGIEIGLENIERRYSQSFRSLDYLRHGLPLIVESHLPITELIKQYEAGWVLNTVDDLKPLLKSIIEDPSEWKKRSANAYKLVKEALDPAASAAPLMNWLEAPVKAKRLPGYGLPGPAPPVLGVPPWKERLARRYRLARRIVLARLFDKHGPKQDSNAIVMVTRGDIFPADHGAAVKIVETARGLTRLGRDVYLVSDDRGHYGVFRNDTFEKQALPWWLRLIARPLPLVKLDHYTRDIPESNAFLYLPLTDSSFFWRVLYVAGKTGSKVLQAEFPAYAAPCQQAGAVLEAATILVEHNVEYERLRAQVPELTRDQFERFRSIEIDLCNRSDAVICVSDNDMHKLALDGVHEGLLHLIPHGIDLEAFDQAKPWDARNELGIPLHAPILVYHGTYAYPPNRDALQMFEQEILPRLENKGIQAHVLAVGHSPPEINHPRIHCTGSVESVAPYLKAADLSVIPLREGGGTRMKIIDCFAAALPVISTSKGIEGIPVHNDHDALVRDDWDQMCDAIGEVLADHDLASELARNGHRIAKTLDWKLLAQRYLKVHAAARV